MIAYTIYCDSCGVEFKLDAEMFFVRPDKPNEGYKVAPEVSIIRALPVPLKGPLNTTARVFCSWKCAVREVQGEVVKGL